MTDLERDATPRAVEFVPFPDEGPLLPLGSTPLEDDPPLPMPWLVPGIILLMLGVAVVAAVAALSGGRTDRVAGVAETTLAVPDVSVPDGPRPIPEVVDTSVPAAVTVAPTNPPPTNPPPTTLAAPAPATLPDGWVEFVAPDQGYRVELPASPTETSEEVRTSAGTATRVEQIVEVPGGTIGIGSVSRRDGDQDPDQFLDGVARSAARQLQGELYLGVGQAVGTGRSLDFTVDYDGGQLRARAVHVDGRLHLLTATGDVTVDAAFERVRSTFTPE